MAITITRDQIDGFDDDRYRARLINSLSGIKSAVLLGTYNEETKVSNLAVFSSLFHLGANPPLMGFIVRPDISPRHTLENIKNNGSYTVNILKSDKMVNIHHTSARFPADVSEFDACGFKELFEAGTIAPFVEEAPLKWSMKLVRIVDIPENGTHMIIGSIEKILMAKDFTNDDGQILYDEVDPCLVSGLDCYHKVGKGKRFSYAKPDHCPTELVRR